MMSAISADALFRTLLSGVLGTLAGLAFFRALRFNITLYLSGSSPFGPAVLHLVRMLALAAALVVAAAFGAGPLLAAFCGILLARRLALREGR